MQYFTNALQSTTNHVKVLREMMIPVVSGAQYTYADRISIANSIWCKKEFADIKEYSNKHCSGYNSIQGILLTWSPFVDTNTKSTKYFSFSIIRDIVLSRLNENEVKGITQLFHMDIGYNYQVGLIAEVIRSYGYNGLADEMQEISKSEIKIKYS